MQNKPPDPAIVVPEWLSLPPSDSAMRLSQPADRLRDSQAKFGDECRSRTVQRTNLTISPLFGDSNLQLLSP